jgi:hypothetical protein
MCHYLFLTGLLLIASWSAQVDSLENADFVVPETSISEIQESFSSRLPESLSEPNKETSKIISQPKQQEQEAITLLFTEPWVSIDPVTVLAPALNKYVYKTIYNTADLEGIRASPPYSLNAPIRMTGTISNQCDTDQKVGFAHRGPTRRRNRPSEGWLQFVVPANTQDLKFDILDDIKSVSTSSKFTFRGTTSHYGTCTGTDKELDLADVRLTTVDVHSSADATCEDAKIRTDGTLRSCTCNAGFT